MSQDWRLTIEMENGTLLHGKALKVDDYRIEYAFTAMLQR